MMTSSSTLTTARLRLEPFAPMHADGLLALNSDPEVMRYLGPAQTQEDVDKSISRQREKWVQHGFGWWAVIETSTGLLVGAACLQHLAHIETNPLEIGWRLLPSAQGKGYATEAGQAAMDYGFDVAGESYLTAVADPENTASTAVMKRLGMRYIGVEEHYDVDCVVYGIHKADRPHT